MRFSRAAAAATFVAGLLTPGGAAQAQPTLEARLVEFPPWLEPDGTLAVEVEVSNSGDEAARDLRVGIAIHEGIETRSQLERTFRGRLGPVVGGDTHLVEGSIEAGATRTIRVEKPLAEISFFRSTRDDRAYPVRITVRAGRASAPAIDAHMVFFARPAPVPLRLVLVVPLHAPAVYDPSGAVTLRATGLEHALAEGRLDVILDALEAETGVPVQVAPSGLLLDTLEDLADGYELRSSSGTRTVARSDPPALAASVALDRFRRLGERPEIGIVTLPYSAAFLPGLDAARVQAHVAAARARIDGVLASSPLEAWILPTGGAVDEPRLAALVNAGASRVILAASSTRRKPEPLTRAVPVEVETRTPAPAAALVADEGLGERLRSERLTGIQARQRFLAETAAIMLERPAQRRVVAALAPLDWDPDPEMLRGILGAMARSPWMRGITLDDAVAGGGGRPKVELASTESLLSQGPVLSGGYSDALREARRAIEQYADLAPPKGLLAALERRLLIAESADWAGGRRQQQRGRAFALAVGNEVRREFQKVRAPAPLTITLTSRTGVIPLSITSAAAYPVDVVIRLDSAKLRFPSGDRCSAPPFAGACIARRLQPRTQTIEVPTIAEVTGTFPLRVTLQTPNRGVPLDSSRLVVRSTAYNLVAVAITGGAGLFLVVWWLAGIFRPRRKG